MCDLYNVGLHYLLNDLVSLLIISLTQKIFLSFKRKETYFVYKPHTTTLKIANGLFFLFFLLALQPIVGLYFAAL